MIKCISDERKSLAYKAVEVIASEVADLLIMQRRGHVVLGICGGGSVEEIFKALSASESMPWHQVHIFWIDERLDSNDSNEHLARELFLQGLINEKEFPKENIHSPKEEGYTEELLALGGFDIILMSSGGDGHVASLFPHHPALQEEDKKFIIVDDSPKPPKRRITASKALLQDATTCLLLFYGKEKSVALKAFSDIDTSIDECPAVLTKEITNLYIFTDII
ncbi:MAG: 6-phosphogluconolactonase [Waddliaceae bacterium]|jgi:6-phosphogluconolactonase|nr:6-phosphogluconolactonase [Waddliaceae bacterium]MBT3578763.1 6-phosphogluconolactonase [Waddliaceae bacterium]MBT4444411.1 6-phosphogluconolactonase [Waddliaceae bacterium]MBT6927877.1 6-phosphogluconolactonase [Waddliaceae bacterium]MBT7265221.1 6-phosphogluconolactonase [Waddliaceae bacterium]